ncbi:MAG: ATP-binding protein [Anaerolineae bacterium]|jgi:two-component system phosphate regulon sensor histidine kinase PhoR
MLRSLRWRIAIPYTILILAATLGLTIYLSGQIQRVRLADLEAQLLAEARLLADRITPLLTGARDPQVLDRLAQDYSDLLGARVTIIGPEGTVLGESHENRTEMDNHLNRPEVQRALLEGQGTSRRYSATVRYEMMYTAVPVRAGDTGELVGFVRVALPLRDIEEDAAQLRQGISAAGAFTALLAGVLALLIAGRTTQPLRELQEGVQRIATGDLSTRLRPRTRDEIGQLTRAFNDMADELRDQMTTLAEERGRLSAVLDHMADGVLITDEAGRVQLLNAAAARILDTTEQRAVDGTLAQIAPYYSLIELWKDCRERGEEQIETLEIPRHGLFLQAIITPFEQAEAEGYLVILQDLTRIRRLETVRRDFISNISHELRTPLAGLKALVDTLRGGAIKDPPAAKRFLKRMDAEVDDLTQMVEELLELSRIESGQVPLRLAPTPVSDVLIPPVDRLRPQAERAGLDLTLQVPAAGRSVLADVGRAQQVVTNLVHNAVKFTAPGGSITVSAEPAGDEVVISVTDTGVGIAAEELTRIFERFYKADRARSGGGTGLGLAIAKHIVQGHGGHIWAESVEGEGSIFYFTLQMAR